MARRGARTAPRIETASVPSVSVLPRVLDAAAHQDGWVNMYTGLNVRGLDKRASTDFQPARRWTRIELEERYKGDAMAAKVVDVLPEDMCREWIDITIDGDPQTAQLVGQQLRKMKAQENLEWALKMSRLHGGSAAILGIDDGRPLNTPLREDSIKRLSFINVLDRWQFFTQPVWYRDPTEPKYGQVELYRLLPIFGVEALMQEIHETRMIVFQGLRMPDRIMLENWMWGDSVLTRLDNAIRNYQTVHDSASTIVQDFAVAVYKLKNLADAMANGSQGGDQKLIARFRAMQIGMSMVRGIVLDAEAEDYHRQATTVTGLDKLISAAERRLAAETSMPHNRLLAESPGASLGEGGAAQDRQWYDHVKAAQERLLREPIERLVRYILLSKEGPTKGKLPKKWSVTFRPLWQLDETGQADVYLKQAQGDEIYAQMGAASPDEIAMSRFGSQQPGAQLQLDMQARSLLSDNPPEVEGQWA